MNVVTNRHHGRRTARTALLVMALAIPVLAHGPGSDGSPVGPINMASDVLVAPAAGRGIGAHESLWITDLWIRGEVGDLVTLELHAMDAPSAEPMATTTVPLTRPVVYLPDVVRNQFGFDRAFGNIVIRSGNGDGIGGTIRVYDDSPSGTYGFSLMAMPASMGMGAYDMMGDRDEHRFYIQGLLPEPQARVNVRVTNPGEETIQGTVEVIDADGGVPATGAKVLPFTISGWSAHQFDDVLAGVHSRFGTDEGLQIVVELDDSSPGMMMVLTSVVDNATNDAYTVMGNMMAPHQGGGMMP